MVQKLYRMQSIRKHYNPKLFISRSFFCAAAYFICVEYMLQQRSEHWTLAEHNFCSFFFALYVHNGLQRSSICIENEFSPLSEFIVAYLEVVDVHEAHTVCDRFIFISICTSFFHGLLSVCVRIEQPAIIHRVMRSHWFLFRANILFFRISLSTNIFVTFGKVHIAYAISKHVVKSFEKCSLILDERRRQRKRLATQNSTTTVENGDKRRNKAQCTIQFQ